MTVIQCWSDMAKGAPGGKDLDLFWPIFPREGSGGNFFATQKGV